MRGEGDCEIVQTFGALNAFLTLMRAIQLRASYSVALERTGVLSLYAFVAVRYYWWPSRPPDCVRYIGRSGNTPKQADDLCY